MKFPHFKHKSLRGSFTGKISSPSRRMSKMSYMSYIMDTEEHRYIMQCEMCSPVVVGGSCSDLCADNLISPHQSSSCTWTFPPPARPIPAPRCTILHIYPTPCNTGSRSGSNHEQHCKNWLNCEIRLSKMRYRYQINAIIKLTDPVIIRD